MRKIIAVILALVLALSVSAVAFATEGEILAEITFDEDGNPASSSAEVKALAGRNPDGSTSLLIYAPVGAMIKIGDEIITISSRRTGITVPAPQAPEATPVANNPAAPEPATADNAGNAEAEAPLGFFARIIAWLQSLFSGIAGWFA